MNEISAKIFQELQYHGKLKRENKTLWDAHKSNYDIQQEVEMLCNVYNYDLVECFETIYMIPALDATVGIKSNADIKLTAGYQNMSSENLNIMYFIVVFILMEFFSGEDAREPVLTFIIKSELLERFNEFCQNAEREHAEALAKGNNDLEDDKYSNAFIDICMSWGAKPQKNVEKDADKALKDRTIGNKEGMLNLAITFMKRENLIIDDPIGETIRPSQKCIDLMPYFLSKQRLNTFLNWERKN